MEYNSDNSVINAGDLRKTMRLVDAIHFQDEEDGSALAVDDRTLTSAHVNKSAHILLQALRQPKTRTELATVFAGAADCTDDEAAGFVNQFVDELIQHDWVEYTELR